MIALQDILSKSVNCIEIICAITGLLYYQRLKNTYWKWFVIYLVFIALAELLNVYVILESFIKFRKYYFDFIIIPIEFLFLFWLFAKKSLQKNMLYTGSILAYLCFLIPHIFYVSQTRVINQLSYTVGCFLLFIMCVLEFIKQIKSDDIVNFRSNKMFYINIGVVLFYIGTMPFFTFDKFLYENQRDIWNSYKLFFLFSDNIMYLLFTASFIWGKPKT